MSSGRQSTTISIYSISAGRINNIPLLCTSQTSAKYKTYILPNQKSHSISTHSFSNLSLGKISRLNSQLSYQFEPRFSPQKYKAHFSPGVQSRFPKKMSPKYQTKYQPKYEVKYDYKYERKLNQIYQDKVEQPQQKLQTHFQQKQQTLTDHLQTNQRRSFKNQSTFVQKEVNLLMKEVQDQFSKFQEVLKQNQNFKKPMLSPLNNIKVTQTRIITDQIIQPKQNKKKNYSFGVINQFSEQISKNSNERNRIMQQQKGSVSNKSQLFIQRIQQSVYKIQKSSKQFQQKQYKIQVSRALQQRRASVNSEQMLQKYLQDSIKDQIKYDQYVYKVSRVQPEQNKVLQQSYHQNIYTKQNHQYQPFHQNTYTQQNTYHYQPFHQSTYTKQPSHQNTQTKQNPYHYQPSHQNTYTTQTPYHLPQQNQSHISYHSGIKPQPIDQQIHYEQIIKMSADEYFPQTQTQSRRSSKQFLNYPIYRSSIIPQTIQEGDDYEIQKGFHKGGERMSSENKYGQYSPYNYNNYSNQFNDNFIKTRQNLNQGFKQIQENKNKLQNSRKSNTKQNIQNPFHTINQSFQQLNLNKTLQKYQQQLKSYCHPKLNKIIQNFINQNRPTTTSRISGYKQPLDPYLIKLRDSGQFLDSEFKPSIYSLVNNINRPKSLWLNICWRKPIEIFVNFKVKLFSQQISYKQIQYGLLQAPYLYQMISYLANKPNLLSKLFKSKNNSYSVIISKNGQFTQILLDDLFPVIKRNNQLIPSFVQPIIDLKKKVVYIWPLLLQKALAKMFSTYQSLQSEKNLLGDCFKQLSGGTFIEYNLSNTQQLMPLIKGQNQIYLYGKNKYERLIGIKSHNSNQYFQFLNNQFDSNIKFKSKLLDTKLKNTIQASVFIQRKQLSIIYQKVRQSYQLIVLYNRKCITERIKSMEVRQTLRKFKISQPGECLIDLTQTDLRFSRNKSKYGFLRAMLVNENGKYIDSMFINKKTGTLKVFLQPGKYYLYINCNWQNKKLCDITLAIYNEQIKQIEEEPLDQPQIQKLLQKMCPPSFHSNKISLRRYIYNKAGMIFERYDNPFNKRIEFQRDLGKYQGVLQMMMRPKMRIYNQFIEAHGFLILRIRMLKMDDINDLQGSVKCERGVNEESQVQGKRKVLILTQ